MFFYLTPQNYNSLLMYCIENTTKIEVLVYQINISYFNIHVSYFKLT